MPASELGGAPRPWLRRGLLEAASVIALVWVLACIPLLGASNRHTLIALQCLIWVLATYGLFVSFSFTGQLTVAVITTWAVSTFTCLLAANAWGWGLELLIPVGLVSGAVAGLIFGLPILRTSGHYFIVVTFAIAELAVIAGHNWDRIDNNRAGVFLLEPTTIFGQPLDSETKMLVVAAAVTTLAILAIALIRQSRVGARFTSVRENAQLAQTLGCPVKVYKLVSLVLGGAITGLAGPLIIVVQRHAQLSDYGVASGITLVVLLVLGGKTYLLGPLLGGVFWFFGPEFIGADPLVGQAIFGLLMAFVVIVSPKGIAALAVGVAQPVARALRRGDAQSAAASDASSTDRPSTRPDADVDARTGADTTAMSEDGLPSSSRSAP